MLLLLHVLVKLAVLIFFLITADLVLYVNHLPVETSLAIAAFSFRSGYHYWLFCNKHFCSARILCLVLEPVWCVCNV